MPTNHDAVAALPAIAAANKALLRDLLVKRMAYCLTSAESSEDFVAVDPVLGATTLVLIQNGRVYSLDPLDTTTEHDGVTCLVSSEGKVYKLDDLIVPYSVLDKDLTEPPADPEIGDSYLLADPGEGDWSAFAAGVIVVLTARGWEEVAPSVGFMIYVVDEDAYYHVDGNGDVVGGLGVGSIAAGSLFPSHLLLGGSLVTWMVENQTTSAPPGSPTEGVTYIVAAAGSGAWLGWDGSIARYENGAWVRYQPTEGWRAYDKNNNVITQFDGTNWRNDFASQAFASSGTWTKPNLGNFVTFMVWGGGGSGGSRTGAATATGGGGGACKILTLPMSLLPATLDITVGLGGASANNAHGNGGGVSRVSSAGITLVQAFGGGGGALVSSAGDWFGGAGGGTKTAGGNSTAQGVLPTTGTMETGAPNDAHDTATPKTTFGMGFQCGGGAGGAWDNGLARAGDNSSFGGAGGGAANTGTSALGGISVAGGNGGNGNGSLGPGDDGSVPGGGGGAGLPSGKGGDGRVLVIVF